jgi:hypothetical protein
MLCLLLSMVFAVADTATQPAVNPVLTITVIDTERRPIPQARVHLRHHMEGRFVWPTDAKGRVRQELRPGHYELLIEKDKYEAYGPVPLHLISSETLRIVLKPKGLRQK